MAQAPALQKQPFLPRGLISHIIEDTCYPFQITAVWDHVAIKTFHVERSRASLSHPFSSTHETHIFSSQLWVVDAGKAGAHQPLQGDGSRDGSPSIAELCRFFPATATHLNPFIQLFFPQIA